MESYQYDALSLRCIRLARILPQSSEVDIHISLEVAALDQGPAYDALSYTWGPPCTVFSTAHERDAPPEPAVPITCDGKRLLVSKNLQDYLCVWLRMAQLSEAGTDERVQQAQETGMHSPRALWIDAICINQGDIAEKNHQVAMMGQIYLRAQRVIVWLGPEDAFVRPALALLFKLCETGSARALKLRHLPDDGKCKVLGVPEISSSAWWPCFAFVNRAWFSRAWIVQELALAPRLHVQCGMLSFSWEVLTEACNVLRLSKLDESLDSMALQEMEGPRLLEPHFYDDLMPIILTEDRPDSDRHLFSSRGGRDLCSTSFIIMLQRIRQSAANAHRPEFEAIHREFEAAEPTRKTSVPMFKLLDEARTTDCFDPRDKVYAFLEIAKQPFYQTDLTAVARRELVPDYGLSIARVFLESAWYLLLSGQNLDLLSIAYKSGRGGANSIPSLPSWVPDWTCRADHTPMTGLHAFMEGKWCATGQATWEPPNEDKPYHPYLTVKGLLVDVICAAAEVADEFSLSRAALIARELPEVYPWSSPPQRRSEVFWRTLIADSTETEHPAPDFNVLFYNDIWLPHLKRACREQFESREKAEEWRRLVKSYRLFKAVAEALKRSPEAEQDRAESDAKPNKAVVHQQPVTHDTSPHTQSIIRHLERTTNAPSMAPMSQTDIALGLMTRGAGLSEGDGPLQPINDKDDKATSAVLVDKPSSTPTRVPSAAMREDEFRRLMTRFTRGRRVFRTEKDYLGNGLANLEVGDQVWLLAGAKVPITLRPLESGRYALVGEAYVHGLMHGEGWAGADLALSDIELE